MFVIFHRVGCTGQTELTKFNNTFDKFPTSIFSKTKENNGEFSFQFFISKKKKKFYSPFSLAFSRGITLLLGCACTPSHVRNFISPAGPKKKKKKKKKKKGTNVEKCPHLGSCGHATFSTVGIKYLCRWLSAMDVDQATSGNATCTRNAGRA